MPTNNQLLKTIAGDSSENIRTNNQLLQIIADGGGGGTGEVSSVNGKSGTVVLTADDIDTYNKSEIDTKDGDLQGGIDSLSILMDYKLDKNEASFTYATIDSPSFEGTPTAPTADPGTSDQQLATTEFVMNNAGGGGSSGLELVKESVLSSAGSTVSVTGLNLTSDISYHVVMRLACDSGRPFTNLSINGSQTGWTGSSLDKFSGTTSDLPNLPDYAVVGAPITMEFDITLTPGLSKHLIGKMANGTTYWKEFILSANEDNVTSLSYSVSQPYLQAGSYLRVYKYV